jgi:hypothetical protein
VVRDVRNLIREQPDVQRVQHRAHGRYGEVRLHVLLVVPHEGADPLVAVDTERPQAMCQPRHVRGDLGERRAPVRAALTESDDPRVSVDVAAVPEDRGNRQRDVLHRASHDGIVL